MDESSLTKQAIAGRGLYVALHQLQASSTPDFQLVVTGYPRITDPHVTLAHLGKQAEHYVAPALHAAHALAGLSGPIEARVGATARFRGSESAGDPIVFLLETPIIRSLAARFRDELTNTGAPVRNSGYFDYKPHVTIARVPRGDDATLTHPPDLAIVFRSVVVVCGEARVHFPFRG